MTLQLTFSDNLSFIRGFNPTLVEHLEKAALELSFDSEVALLVNGERWFDNINALTAAQLEAQTQSLDRVLFARVRNEASEIIPAEILSNLVDTEDLVILPSLPNLVSSCEENSKGALLASDIVLLGAFSLLYVQSIQRTNPPNSIVLIEADVRQLAAVLHLLDFAALIRDLRSAGTGFHLIIQDQDPTVLQAEFLAYYADNNPLAFHGLRIYRSFRLHPSLIEFHAWLHARDGLAEYVKGFLGNDTDEFNQVVHATWNSLVNSQSQRLLRDVIVDDYPVVIVASGPSLDSQIEWLRKYHRHFTIVSAGSAVGTLLRSGIHVDAAVLLEMGSVVFRDISDLLLEGHDLRNITLIGSITLDPRIAPEFGRTIFFHRPLSSALCLVDGEETSCLPQAGPQAANAAIEVVLQLGTRKLLLLGCDFAAADRDFPRSRLAIGNSERRFDLPVRGNQGRTIFSSAELSITRQLFENALHVYGAEATCLGEGSWMDGVRVLKEPDYELLCQEFGSDRASFDIAIATLPDRRVNAEALRMRFVQAREAMEASHASIRDVLSESHGWTHALAKRLAGYVSWRDDMVPVPTRLQHRLTRFLLFFVFQPLHDCPDQRLWPVRVNAVSASLSQISLIFSAYFKALESLCVAPRLPVWDAQWMAKRLIASLPALDDDSSKPK